MCSPRDCEAWCQEHHVCRSFRLRGCSLFKSRGCCRSITFRLQVVRLLCIPLLPLIHYSQLIYSPYTFDIQNTPGAGARACEGGGAHPEARRRVLPRSHALQKQPGFSVHRTRRPPQRKREKTNDKQMTLVFLVFDVFVICHVFVLCDKTRRTRHCHTLSQQSPNERLYKPPMNPYVVSSCLRASLRFPYATHVLAYAAVSKHVKLTHGLRGVLSVSPQELLTRAPFLMQTPELFKTLRKKMTKNYPHESQRLGIVVLAASQETGYSAAASIARASGQPS